MRFTLCLAVALLAGMVSAEIETVAQPAIDEIIYPSEAELKERVQIFAAFDPTATVEGQDVDANNLGLLEKKHKNKNKKADHSRHQKKVDHSHHQNNVDHSHHQKKVDHSHHKKNVDHSHHEKNIDHSHHQNEAQDQKQEREVDHSHHQKVSKSKKQQQAKQFKKQQQQQPQGPKGAGRFEALNNGGSGGCVIYKTITVVPACIPTKCPTAL
ncbi:hypothetical protein BGZ83_001403 [Gryganskiella cystojenkinii]|nr:hypothetical protein BGZ83_001403 [Gryganskiella cystojenkinii]